eukprot:gb/GFBE01072230.1/.p1 GENE.gb/GFBE01072230.1/~~gb/GFBE01072230.1/.p1  ORF type:complete len:707 (+),score=252.63 gb/GFBE01072230.1/:1-2121(+)
MGLWRVALVTLFALSRAQDEAAAAAPAPPPLAEKTVALKKVTTLLQELVVQLADDAEADSAQHGKFVNLTEENIAKAEETIETSESTIATLNAQLEAARALQEEKKDALRTAANSLLEAQQELQLAQNQRLSEKETFQSSSQKLQKSTDNINLALETVSSLFGSASDGDAASPSPAPGTGLLQATKKLRSALDAGAGDLLDSKQQQMLTRLLGAAGDGRKVARKKASSAVGFLQVSSQSDAEEDEALEEGFGGGSEPGVGDLTATLTEVKEQTSAEHTAITEAEEKSSAAYQELSASLQSEVDVRQAAVTEIQSAISSSEEAESRDKSELLSAERLLAVTKSQLTQLKVDLEDKKKDFAERTKSRSKETDAVKETLTLLTADQQADASKEAAAGGVAFVQISQSHSVQQASRRKAAKLMSKATSPGLAALLLQSQSTLGRKDVLKKVKDMIREMLGKLQEQQAQDARRDAWCKAETANTESSKENKLGRAEKLKTKMGAYDAELATLGAEIATISADVSDMKEALLAQEELRAQESEKAKSDIIMYQEDQRVLREALVVLKRVYPDQTASKDESGYQAKAQGTGVVALLETSLDQFTNLEEETTKAEKEAQADFEDMKSTTEIRLATFEKDLEYKGARQTKLEGELVAAKSDFDSYQKEIEALNEYLKELEASCVVKGASFEDRKMKRESQLDSLKEALQYLAQEG